jgi:aminopeptidase N
LYGHSVFAQDEASVSANLCSSYKQNGVAHTRTTVLSKDEDNYDVQYVKLDIALTNLNVAISGNVTTRAKVIADNITVYTFELSDSLRVDSVIINNQSLSYSHINGVCTATLSSVLAKGSTFTATVFYHGTPKTGNGFFDLAGLNHDTVDEYGVQVTYTLSEPYASSDWWPCKQSLKDKIDSADIWITVPSGLKAGSNGLLKKITLPGAGLLRYEWHTNYPIDYYLISASVAPYVDYSFRVPITGVTDSLLVQNYIYDAPGAMDNYKKGFDSTAQMLQYFSQLYGPYPFYKEKYGHCLAPLHGGMEHQTMTTCGNSGSLLVSHELAHQWFGDHVTCATWKDVWLNEGFATYSEYLFLQKIVSDTAAEKRMWVYHNSLLAPKDSNGTIYVDDTTNFYRIFDGRLSYNKAAIVINTLRFVINNDSIFFAILKKYQQQFAFGTATTEGFKQIAEQVSQTGLDRFFDQWIYKEGYPVYSAEWNTLNKEVFVKLKQTTTNPQSVSLFVTPIEIKFSSPQGDTIVRINNTLNEQVYKFGTDRQITNISIDPNNKLLNADRGVIKNIELGLNLVSSTVIRVLPNPAVDYWYVVGMPPQCDIIMTDLSGKVIKTANNEANSGMIIYTDGLSRGMYVLHLLQGKVKIATLKLIKL